MHGNYTISLLLQQMRFLLATRYQSSWHNVALGR
jgi:hypothetical protein